MIHEVSGDILLGKAQVLAHGIAANDPVNHGLALSRRFAMGVGGLDWNEVKPLLEDRLSGLGVPVFVYTEFHAGKAAQAPGL